MKRIGNSFKGIVGGVLLILIGIVLLWWNEGNNVRNIRTTAEMEKVVIDVKSDKVDSKNDGKLIATNGTLINEEELTDEALGITIKTPKMIRVVEVYQWDEHSSTDDDGHTTYSYSKKWSDDLIDSGNFHNKNKTNPTTKLYENQTLTSSDVKVGAFSLSSNQISKLSTKATFTAFDAAKVSELNLTSSGKYLTNSKDIDHPEIGDTRIEILYHDATEASVLAVQQGNTFVDFVSKYDKRVNRVEDGTHSGKEMINVIKEEDNFLKWILRLIGVLLIVFGFAAVLGPISAITSFIPILGSIVGGAVALVSLVLGLALSLVIIAVAWIRFRPLLGISLLVIVALLVAFLIIRGKKTKSENTTQENNS